MKRKKIFLAKKLQFFCGIPYFPFLIFWIIVIVKQSKTMQSSSVLWLIIGLILFSIVELPFFLIPGTATIRFYDDYISYKKNLFVKPTIIYDNKITKLYVDFRNDPPQPNLRQGKTLSAHRGYVMIRHEIVCSFDLNYKLLREWLNHVESNKVKVNFPLSTYTQKRYFSLLESCLSEKQKRDMRSRWR